MMPNMMPKHHVILPKSYLNILLETILDDKKMTYDTEEMDI